MKSIKPGKQRKRLYNAPLHKKRKWISAHLEENLLLKYDRRSISVIKGDTVKVMRGSFKGHEDKVVGVNTKKGLIEIEGLVMSKADGNKIPKPIHSSNVLITKLNLTDKWRRKKLETGVSEETKKEIEEEAAEQIKEEEKLRKEEEEKRKEEKEKEQEKEKEEKEEKDVEKKETPKTEKKQTTDKPKKKSKPEKKSSKKKKTESKKKTQTKTKTKKTSGKKNTSSKKNKGGSEKK